MNVLKHATRCEVGLDKEYSCMVERIHGVLAVVARVSVLAVLLMAYVMSMKIVATTCTCSKVGHE